MPKAVRSQIQSPPYHKAELSSALVFLSVSFLLIKKREIKKKNNESYKNKRLKLCMHGKAGAVFKCSPSPIKSSFK